MNDSFVPIQKSGEDDPIQSIMERVEQDDNYVKWKKANDRMGSGSDEWSLILIRSDMPNAFVTELIPVCPQILRSYPYLNEYLLSIDVIYFFVTHLQYSW